VATCWALSMAFVTKSFLLSSRSFPRAIHSSALSPKTSLSPIYSITADSAPKVPIKERMGSMIGTILGRRRKSTKISRMAGEKHNHYLGAMRMLRWKRSTSAGDGYEDYYDSIGDFNIATFNLLAPCYKRLNTRDVFSGRRYREASDIPRWTTRAKDTLEFFKNELYPTSIIALQEFWLEENYRKRFQMEFEAEGYELRTLQRTGKKMDAVALAIKRSVFEIKGSSNVLLCSQGDRVALLLWLLHRVTGKNVLVANTHLSFPHNVFDRMNQMRQMQTLTEAIDAFIKDNNVGTATHIITGDFNVEAQSPVCDHLRESGYFNCFEVSPPSLTMGEPTSPTTLAQKSIGFPQTTTNPSKPIVPLTSYPSNVVRFVSHRNHRSEEVGVDHIFVKPEYEVMEPNHPRIQNSSGDKEISGSTGHREAEMNINETKTEVGYLSSSRLRRNSKIEELPTTFNGAVFVKDSSVLPRNLSCTQWPHEEFTISDHRPVGSTLIFARMKNGVEMKSLVILEDEKKKLVKEYGEWSSF